MTSSSSEHQFVLYAFVRIFADSHQVQARCHSQRYCREMSLDICRIAYFRNIADQGLLICSRVLALMRILAQMISCRAGARFSARNSIGARYFPRVKMLEYSFYLADAWERWRTILKVKQLGQRQFVNRLFVAAVGMEEVWFCAQQSDKCTWITCSDLNNAGHLPLFCRNVNHGISTFQVIGERTDTEGTQKFSLDRVDTSLLNQRFDLKQPITSRLK